MRIICFLIVLCSFHNSFQAALEIPETRTKSDIGESTPTPEETNIRTESPTETILATATDLTPLLDLLDVDDTTVPESANKFKRCSRHNILIGAEPDVVTLSLSRRDVSPDRRKQQCENCLNTKLCKTRNICSGCKLFCDNLEQMTTPKMAVSDLDNAIPSEANPLVSAPNPENAPQIDSRLANVEPSYRYYTLGTTGQKSTINLLARVFNIANKTNYEKVIVLGQTKAPPGSDTFIMDSAQAFSSSPQILRIANDFADPANPNNLIQAIKDALDQRQTTLNTKQLTLPQINQVLDDTLNQLNSPKLEETQTRCDLLDEAAEELVDIASRTHPETQAQENEIPTKTEPKIHNPPVIQDTANVVGKEPETEEMIDDNEEAKPSLPSRLHTKPIGNKKGKSNILAEPTQAQPPQSENQIKEKEPRTFYQSSEENSSSSSSSEEEYLGKNNPTREDLKENIIHIVEDSLKAASRENDLLEEPNQVGQEEPRPNGARFDDVMQEIKKIPEIITNVADDVQKEADTIRNLQQNRQGVPNLGQRMDESIEEGSVDLSPESIEVPNLVNEPIVEPNPVNEPVVEPMQIVEEPKAMPESNGAIPQVSENKLAPEIEARFPEEAPLANTEVSLPPHFGALVPEVAGARTSSNRNYYFVGKDINLPLQMVEDENGVVRLTVDMSKLCTCKRKNCTRRHASDEVTDRTIEHEAAEIPRTRFNRESDNEKMYDLIDSLHLQSEGSNVFKREAVPDQEFEKIQGGIDDQEENDELTRIFDEYKMEEKIEEDLNKLNELNNDVEKLSSRKMGLFNKGTVALLRNGERTQRSDRMLNLANDLLQWLKELAAQKRQALDK